MRKKPKRLFLYLAIACFAGLVAIFIVDGYLGIYDTFHISVGEYPPQTIEANYWLRQGYEGYDIPRAPGTEGDKYAYCCIGADWGQDISFDYVIENHRENDVVVPDQFDLEQYSNGDLTWQGFRVNYLAKLMRPEAEEWMKRICTEAVSEDVVLISDEENIEKCYRTFLAEMMISMFSGHMNLRYMGELKV